MYNRNPFYPTPIALIVHSFRIPIILSSISTNLKTMSQPQEQNGDTHSTVALLLDQAKNVNGVASSSLPALFARSAFELRKVCGQQRQDGDKAVEREQKECAALWRRVCVLVRFGMAEDSRLAYWMGEMAVRMLQGGERRANVAILVDRLEWAALSLSLHSMPDICSPKSFLIGSSFPTAPSLSPSSLPFQVRAEAAARVDLAGGWSDTPPITYQCESPPAVLNLAIRVNGVRPLRCICARLQQHQGIFYTEQHADGSAARTLVPLQHFTSAEAVFAQSCLPSRPGSLLCAILVVAGIVREELCGGERRRYFAFGQLGRGIHIRTESDLPHGSGLGASSILAGAVLAALWRLCAPQQPIDEAELVHSVLRVEQLHTTGGGWQDQIGGCIAGGFKLGSVSPTGRRQCHWRVITVPQGFGEDLANRLVLVYTGKTRLAKHLLSEVLLSWARGQPEILQAVSSLSDGARQAAKQLQKGGFPCSFCAQYNELKKAFTPQTEPPLVSELVAEFARQRLAEVAWMAGAGGGGFLYVWLTKGTSAAAVQQLLANDERWSGMSVWRVQMETDRPLAVH